MWNVERAALTEVGYGVMKVDIAAQIENIFTLKLGVLNLKKAVAGGVKSTVCSCSTILAFVLTLPAVELLQ